MKKSISIILVIILILSVFASCTGKGKPKEPEQPTPSNTTEDVAKTDDVSSTEPEVTEKREKKYTLKEGEKLETKYITEKYSYSGKFRWCDDETQSIEDYVLRLPQLKSSSDSAKALNKRICDEYEEMIEKSIEAYEFECYLVNKVSWESYLYNDIISIVITTRDYMTTFSYYSVYNFNVKTEKEVTNSEILKSVGLTESEFISKTKEAAKEEFSKVDFSHVAGGEEIKKEELEYMLSEDNISINTPIFIDDSGTLNAIIKICQSTGVDHEYDKYEIIKIK